MQLFNVVAKIFKKIFCPPKHKKNCPKNPTIPTILSPTSFCFVKLRQFYSLIQ